MGDLNPKPARKLLSIDFFVTAFIVLAIGLIFIFLTQGKAPAVNVATVIVGVGVTYVLILALIVYLIIRLITWIIKKSSNR